MVETKLGAQWKTLSPYLLSLLRIVAAALFMMHGTQILFAFPAGMGNAGTAHFPTEIWFAGSLEAFGGAMLLIGMCTRPIAFVLSGQMAVAYFQAHAQRNYWPTLNGGELAMLYCFVWFYFSAVGAGPWSVDAWLKNAGKYK